MSSGIFRLNSRDLLKGVVVAVLGAVLGALQALLSSKGLDWTLADLEQIATVALTALFAYLIKNFVTDDSDRIGGKF